jgi:EPS-associated MarR family transcriptional regulator
MTKPQSITEDQLDLLHFIQEDGNTSQRLISQNTGFSIGKVNYCLKALIDIGFIKIHNFNNSSQKINYVYILTAHGIKEKAKVTKKFIIKKKLEYDKLNSYINNS